MDPLSRDDRVDGPTEAQLLPPRGGGGRGPFRSAIFRLLVNLPIPLLMQKASYESLALQRAKRQNNTFARARWCLLRRSGGLFSSCDQFLHVAERAKGSLPPRLFFSKNLSCLENKVYN